MERLVKRQVDELLGPSKRLPFLRPLNFKEIEVECASVHTSEGLESLRDRKLVFRVADGYFLVDPPLETVPESVKSLWAELDPLVGPVYIYEISDELATLQQALIGIPPLEDPFPEFESSAERERQTAILRSAGAIGIVDQLRYVDAMLSKLGRNLTRLRPVLEAWAAKELSAAAVKANTDQTSPTGGRPGSKTRKHSIGS
jgi:hypothetical protein